jgi:hypothetical protein
VEENRIAHRWVDLVSRFDFKSTAGAFTSGIQKALLDQELRRREEFMAGLQVDNEMRRRQREDDAARRAAVLGQQADSDRLASLRSSTDLLAPGEADVLTQGGYRVGDVATLPSVSRVGDLASGTMATTTAAPSIYGQQRAESPGEVIARQTRERKIAADAADEAYRNKLKPAQKHMVTVAGPNGQPVQRLVTEDELAAGIPLYVKPERDTTERAKRVWVERNGQPVYVTEDQITFGDKPYKGEGGSDKPTQGQLTAHTFASRAQDALGVIEQLEPQLRTYAGSVPNIMQTEVGQRYEQARKQFTEAYLRKDSGAAIGKDEYANAAATYFPVVGDSHTTIERKAAARRSIVQSLRSQGTGHATTSGPAVGTRGVVNGIPAVWDGRGWLPAGGR